MVVCCELFDQATVHLERCNKRVVGPNDNTLACLSCRPLSCASVTVCTPRRPPGRRDPIVAARNHLSLSRRCFSREQNWFRVFLDVDVHLTYALRTPTPYGSSDPNGNRITLNTCRTTLVKFDAVCSIFEYVDSLSLVVSKFGQR